MLCFSIARMHPLIDSAIETISSWTSDEPSDLTLAVAALCRDTLDSGGLPNGSPDWFKGRKLFEVTAGQNIADSIVAWDDWCRFAEVDVRNDRTACVKLGIVTWTTKFILIRFGMLVGSEAIPDFEEWKQRLCQCLEKYIVVNKNRPAQ
jgi:hypothetical protein